MDGEQVTIRDPEVRADSIVGVDRRVAVSDVQQIETLRFSPGKTVGLLFLTAAAVGAALFAAVVACYEWGDCTN